MLRLNKPQQSFMKFCSSCSCLLLGNEIAFKTKIEKWGKSQEAKVGYLLNNVLLSQYRGKLHRVL